jgi:hypothetical protein
MIKSILVSILLSLLLVQCKQSDKVVSGRSFQKRKYTAGWYHTKSPKRQDVKATHKTTFRDVASKQNPSVDKDLTASSTSETIVISPRTERESSPSSEKTIDKKEASKKASSQAESPKKKKKKVYILPAAYASYFFSALATWFYGWIVPTMNVPVLGLIFGALGVIIGIVGFFTIKKKTKNKGRNIILLCLSILMGLLSVLICAALMAAA